VVFNNTFQRRAIVSHGTRLPLGPSTAPKVAPGHLAYRRTCGWAGHH